MSNLQLNGERIFNEVCKLANMANNDLIDHNTKLAKELTGQNAVKMKHAKHNNLIVDVPKAEIEKYRKWLIAEIAAGMPKHKAYLVSLIGYNKKIVLNRPAGVCDCTEIEVDSWTYEQIKFKKIRESVGYNYLSF